MNTNRVAYVDAMRGVAMIMVVVWHVFSMCLHYENKFAFMFNWNLQIPLFMMVSGFFANKLMGKPLGSLMQSKFMHLVLPALLMMLIYCWVTSRDILRVLYDGYKGGYWFTFVLFIFLIIFYVISKIIGKFVKKESIQGVLHLLIGIIIGYIAQFLEGMAKSHSIIGLLSLNLYYYYPSLVFGSLIYSHRDYLLKNMKMGGVIFVALFANLIFYKYGIDYLKHFAFLISFLVGCMSLTTIWMCFERFPQLSTASRTGRFLSIVGRRSIDVYFLHYFFIPFDLGLLGGICESLNSTVLTYLIALALALVFTVLSLGMGQILRMSAVLAKYFLGVPESSKATHGLKQI